MTGYTYQLVNKDQNFNQFVWSCARNFGALIDMKDESLDAPIDISKPQNTYYVEQLEKHKKKLDELKGLNPYARCQYGENVRIEHNAYYKKELKRVTKERKKMYEMLDEVLVWQPPTSDHVNLKNFMIEQLTESLKFDSIDYYTERLTELENKSNLYIFEEAVEKCEKDIIYYEEQCNKNEDRGEDRRKWLKQLANSVGTPPQ